MNLSFKRALTPCDFAGRYCPVVEPCTLCAEHFNAQPWWKRAYIHFRLEWRTRGLKGKHKRHFR